MIAVKPAKQRAAQRHTVQPAITSTIISIVAAGRPLRITAVIPSL
jgi:hypothetical protein